jgi:hypothetical protein
LASRARGAKKAPREQEQACLTDPQSCKRLYYASELDMLKALRMGELGIGDWLLGHSFQKIKLYIV